MVCPRLWAHETILATFGSPQNQRCDIHPHSETLLQHAILVFTGCHPCVWLLEQGTPANALYLKFTKWNVYSNVNLDWSSISLSDLEAHSMRLPPKFLEYLKALRESGICSYIAPDKEALHYEKDFQMTKPSRSNIRWFLSSCGQSPQEQHWNQNLRSCETATLLKKRDLGFPMDDSASIADLQTGG